MPAPSLSLYTILQCNNTIDSWKCYYQMPTTQHRHGLGRTKSLKTSDLIFLSNRRGARMEPRQFTTRSISNHLSLVTQLVFSRLTKWVRWDRSRLRSKTTMPMGLSLPYLDLRNTDKYYSIIKITIRDLIKVLESIWNSTSVIRRKFWIQIALDPSQMLQRYLMLILVKAIIFSYPIGKILNRVASVKCKKISHTSTATWLTSGSLLTRTLKGMSKVWSISDLLPNSGTRSLNSKYYSIQSALMISRVKTLLSTGSFIMDLILREGSGPTRTRSAWSRDTFRRLKLVTNLSTNRSYQISRPSQPTSTQLTLPLWCVTRAASRQFRWI